MGKLSLFERFAGWLTIWIAWHLPKMIVYHCTIRLAAHATMGEHDHQIVPELTVMDALDRWTERCAKNACEN